MCAVLASGLRVRRRLLALALALAFASRAAADDDVGFGDMVSSEPSSAVEPEEPARWTFSSTYRLESALRVETQLPSRVASFRQLVDLRLEWKPELGAGVELQFLVSGRTEADFAYLIYDARYTAPELELYAWQLLPREAYVRLSASTFELTVGEQIVNYGQAEMLGILDVVNPRDLRHPLFADVGDLRMPVLMTRASLSLDRGRIELVAVHEPYFGLTAPPLGEFSPLRHLLLGNAALSATLAGRELRTRHQPAHDVTEVEATQAHAFFSWSLPNVDLSLLASSVLDSVGVPELPDPIAWSQAAIDFPLVHPRFTLLGTAGAWTLGAFVIRWEAAFALDRPLATLRPNTNLLILSHARSQVVMGLLGLTWVPSLTTSAALEVSQSYVREDLALLFPVEATQFAARFNQSFLSERLTLTLLALLIGVDRFNAWAGRAELSYMLSDGLAVSLGYVTYNPSNQFGVFYGFNRHDRVFATFRWDVVK